MTDRDLHIQGLNLRIRDDGEGDAVVLLHGFPDSGLVWRHQIPVLTESGFRVVTPDLRGFGASDKPSEVAAYALATIVGDVIGILDALAIERAHLVGHDWGAAVAWLVAGIAPARVASLTALSVGHLQSFQSAGFDQREKSWYVLLFQFAGIAERLLMRDDWHLFREFVRHHPETTHWIPALAPPGALTAGLNWYRANLHPAQSFEPRDFPRVRARTLGIWSSNDHYLTEAQMLGSGAYVDGPWRYQRLHGPSHWMQLDRPDALNYVLLDFLRQER